MLLAAMSALIAATTDPSKYLFWITSRAAGTAALVLASVAVGAGLLVSGKVIKGAGPQRRSIHEILSLSVIAAIAVHAGSLLGDTYLHPSLLDVTVPFAFSYKTLPTAIGIVAGWGLIFLGLSYYLRARIGQNRWKSIHRFTALMWVFGLIHAFTEGTDSGQLWFVALIGLTAAPAAVLLVIRHAGAGGSTRGRVPSTMTSARPSAERTVISARPRSTVR
jgi:methionine sulfoxide reductase heme-binding subunit